MMRTKLLLSLLLLFCIVAACTAEEKPAALKMNKRLKEELSLAKSPALYFILDLEGKNISLRSKGMVLQEWKIESFHSWGEQPALEILTVMKKSALFAPKRKKITPGEAEQQGDKFELDALELKDMPSSYAFYLDKGIYLYFRAKPKQFISQVGNIGHLFVWYLWVPLRNLAFEVNKKPFTAINVILGSREDSQAVYWSFSEGIKGLFFYP